jgi:hypothetical protein
MHGPKARSVNGRRAQTKRNLIDQDNLNSAREPHELSVQLYALELASFQCETRSRGVVGNVPIRGRFRPIRGL